MPRRLDTIVCEGRDDLSAIRALVRNEITAKPEATERGFRVSARGRALDVLWVEGKSRLAHRVHNLGTASEQPDVVAVCFDPDLDPEGSDFRFFATESKALTGKQPESLARGRLRLRSGRRDVEVVPAPWRTSATVPFDGAPQTEHSLERVLISGILAAAPPVEPKIRAWAEATCSQLLALVADHGWKRAFRIWNAALDPKTESYSFVDRVLQDGAVGASCLRTLRATPVGDAVAELLAGWPES